MIDKEMIMQKETGTTARRYSRRDRRLGAIPLPESVFQSFEITVTFSLGKRKEDSTKGGIDNVWSEHGNEGAKTVKM